MSRIADRLHRVHPDAVAFAFAFWVLQLAAWVAMMIYVEFFNRRLGDNVLYVTQISHWALVITCGTAATATWALLQAKHNARTFTHLADQTADTQAGLLLHEAQTGAEPTLPPPDDSPPEVS